MIKHVPGDYRINYAGNGYYERCQHIQREKFQMGPVVTNEFF